MVDYFHTFHFPLPIHYIVTTQGFHSHMALFDFNLSPQTQVCMSYHWIEAATQVLEASQTPYFQTQTSFLKYACALYFRCQLTVSTPSYPSSKTSSKMSSPSSRSPPTSNWSSGSAKSPTKTSQWLPPSADPFAPAIIFLSALVSSNWFSLFTPPPVSAFWNKMWSHQALKKIMFRQAHALHCLQNKGKVL